MTNYLNTNFDLNSDQLVEFIDELPFWSAPFGIRLLDHIRYKKNISILDIGFGAGFPITELAMRFGESCKIYGIDPWGAGTRRVKKKLALYGIGNTELIRREAENIPLPDNSIDLITSNNGINNVSNQEKVLCECSRLMKKGGQFVQTMNLGKSMIEFYEIMENVLKLHRMNKEVDKLHQHIRSKRKPLDEFLALIRKNNFSVVEIENNCFEYKFTDGTTMLNHYFIRLAFLDPWKEIVPEEKQAKIFQEIEDLMNEKALANGCFRLSIPFVVIDCIRN
ncbi:MAG: class I SAM-dependent methyltransferase [Bacteroidales bacterium]|nr:class I SAM-dependent methyltransferase [Bacteroidales bacterium]